MHREKSHFFDKPGNVRRILNALYTCCAILLLLDFVVHRHTEHPLEGLWGFYPAYGFIGCVVLVLIAKWMRRFLLRPEDYYDRHSTLENPERGNSRGARHVDA